MKQLTNFLDRLVFLVACGLTAALLSMVLLQMLCRNFFHFSFIQIEEYCVILMSWMSFLAATYAVRHCGHVAVDFFFDKMPKRVRYLLNLGTILGLLFLTAYMTYFGFGLSIRQMRTPFPVTHIPRGYMYLAAPVCSALMVIFFADALITCIREQRITGVVIDADDQIQQELENGKKLMEEVLGKDEKEGTV